MMVGFLVDSRKVVSRDTASLAIDLSWVLWHERQQLLVLCGVAIPPTRELGDWWGRASRLTVWSAFSSDLGTVSVNLFLGSAGSRVPRGRTHDPEPARISQTHGE